MNNKDLLLTFLSVLPYYEGSLKLQKAIYLIQSKTNLFSYNYHREVYGPYDGQILKDLETLKDEGLITINYNYSAVCKKYAITDKGRDKIKDLKVKHDNFISFQELVVYTSNLSKDELLNLVYHKAKVYNYEIGDKMPLISNY